MQIDLLSFIIGTGLALSVLGGGIIWWMGAVNKSLQAIIDLLILRQDE